MEWQPIETAPKDSEILLWFPRWKAKTGRFQADKYSARPRPYWTMDAERLWGVRDVRLNQPTHWMPLPPPPEKVPE